MASISKVAISGPQTTPTVPPSATNEAAHAALFTRELLCNIIGRLPFQGILAATGVCREWRAALVCDPNIREDLFLKPANVRLVLADSKYMRKKEKSIPLDKCAILGTALPFLHRIFDRVNFATGIYLFINSMRLSLYTPNSMRRMRSSAFDVANEFWNDMFITQPPCSKVHIRIFTCRDTRVPGKKLHNIELQRADGIKLGDLYDLFNSHLAEDYNQYYIQLTIRNYFPEVSVRDEYSVQGRVRCKVHNGEIKRPFPPS